MPRRFSMLAKVQLKFPAVSRRLLTLCDIVQIVKSLQLSVTMAFILSESPTLLLAREQKRQRLIQGSLLESRTAFHHVIWR
jgi:hypothetical protein